MLSLTSSFLQSIDALEEELVGMRAGEKKIVSLPSSKVRNTNTRMHHLFCVEEELFGYQGWREQALTLHLRASSFSFVRVGVMCIKI